MIGMTFDHVERVDESTLSTQILFTLVQQIAVYQDQRPCLDFAELVGFILLRSFGLRMMRPLAILYIFKSGTSFGLSNESRCHRGSLVGPLGEAQAAVVDSGILQGDPKAYSARRVRVQEGTILMWRDGASNFGLFAYDHALQHSWIMETNSVGYLAMERSEGCTLEGGRELVQVVANLVNGMFLGPREFARGREGIFLKKESNLVTGGEKIIVANMRGGFSGRELRHWMIFQRERGEHVMCLLKQHLHGGWGQGIRNDEISIFLPLLQLTGCELSWGICTLERRRHEGRRHHGCVMWRLKKCLGSAVWIFRTPSTSTPSKVS